MPVSIRPATTHDLDALLALAVQLSPDSASTRREEGEAALRAILASDAVSLFVAEGDGGVIGTVMAVIVPGLTHGGRSWMQIENMVVDERARREGVGRALLDACADVARAHGCYKMQLQSAHLREGAHAFYARYGFEPSTVGFRLYLP